MVRVFGKEDCKYCRMAKKALEDVGEEFEYTPLDGDDEKKDRMKADNNVQTIPLIFIGDSFLGGYTELEEYLVNKYL